MEHPRATAQLIERRQVMWITVIATALAASICLGMANLAIQLDKGKALLNSSAETKAQLGAAPSAPSGIRRS
jgi:hypothetical protein